MAVLRRHESEPYQPYSRTAHYSYPIFEQFFSLLPLPFPLRKIQGICVVCTTSIYLPACRLGVIGSTKEYLERDLGEKIWVMRGSTVLQNRDYV